MRSKAVAALCAVLGMCPAFAQSGDQTAIQWVASHAVPVRTVEISDDDADLLPIKSAIGASRVVALGEATHGTHQPLAFRNRLFRFLVERMGFTGIALESGFSESINARAFIERGVGNAETAARTGFPGLAGYAETIELVQWMRNHNAIASSAGHAGVRLYGIDIPAGGRLGGARVALDAALAFLSSADREAAKAIQDSLGDDIPAAADGGLGSLSPEAQMKYEAVLENLERAVHGRRRALVALSSAADYRWAVQNLEVARQLARCLQLTPPKSADIGAWMAAETCRDAAMADNVQWALKNEGVKGRVLVFAHTGHVLNSKDDGRRWANVASPERAPLMGFHLRRMFGDDLYIIAMSAATTSGGFRAAKPVEDDSMEKVLAAGGLPMMFLDIRSARQDAEMHAWLSETRSIGATVDAHTLITPAIAADAFFFVRTLTPACRPAAD